MQTQVKKRHEGVCHCKAYPWPHRCGSGKCEQETPKRKEANNAPRKTP